MSAPSGLETVGCYSHPMDMNRDSEHAPEAKTWGELPPYCVESALAHRNVEASHTSYPKRVSSAAVSPASSAALWRVVCRFGSDNEFFSFGLLWWLRRAADRLLGGPSFRRRRRDPEDLQVGDAVDAWRVIALQPERQLTLALDMKVPGEGVLEFEITPLETGREVRATAYFRPAGVWGWLYWYLFVPAHLLVFWGMTREIARRALSPDGE